MISEFSGGYRFLSNFYPCEVELDGVVYPSVEHAFQAAKTLNNEERKQIREADTAGKAKRLGKTVTLRSDWEKAKYSVMKGLLIQKFTKEPFKSDLLKTKDEELIEGNTWNDRVWGCVLIGNEWFGENNLGKLLMEIRTVYSGKSLLKLCF